MTQQYTPAQLEAWAGLEDKTFPLPNLARLVLEKDAEIARLRAENKRLSLGLSICMTNSTWVKGQMTDDQRQAITEAGV